MKVFNEQGNELLEYDLDLGYMTEEQRFVTHHDAVEAVEEVSHYEVVRTYPNGGRDVERVIDIPGVEAREAWDEYETVQIYHPYTLEELAAQNAPTQLDRIEAQVFYTAMMTNTLMEEAAYV